MIKLMLSILLAVVSQWLVAAGCGTGPRESEPEGVVEAELASCCSGGTFLCPGQEVWNYGPPGCDDTTKPAADRACHALCGARCRDSGWKSVPCGPD